MMNAFAYKFFHCWVASVSIIKQEHVDSLLVSLESELDRMRLVQQQYVQERIDFQSRVVELEDEIAMLRRVLHKCKSTEAAALANLEQHRQILAQYDDWQKEFEGFMVTDSAINRLRAHGLKVPPRSPQFVSPAPTPVRATSAAGPKQRAHSSPERQLSSPSDALPLPPPLPLQSPAASGARTNVRRRGGGYDIIGAADAS